MDSGTLFLKAKEPQPLFSFHLWTKYSRIWGETGSHLCQLVGKYFGKLPFAREALGVVLFIVWQAWPWERLRGERSWEGKATWEGAAVPRGHTG